jgi:phosphatidylserine/phosphatidylglycerophosphate/cardiolipin synthase-like enzyme
MDLCMSRADVGSRDDLRVVIGSANLNDRSMKGNGDSVCLIDCI